MNLNSDWQIGSMDKRPLRIIQVNTRDIGGGAEKAAWDLFQSYLKKGYSSWLVVGRKQSVDPNVLVFPNHNQSTLWGRLFGIMIERLKLSPGIVHGKRRISYLSNVYVHLRREVERRLGIEVFSYPGTYRLFHLLPRMPDIVHCHNLHGSYFDLRALPWLCRKTPVILTLHDSWLFSGHCAHSFNCERWKTGCGRCPDLSLYPGIRRDATALNWRRKQKIFSNSRLYVATPSRWLMQKVEQSILFPAILESRIIPSGVDLSIFCPAQKHAVRAILGIPHDANILLFAANGIRRNIFKDYQTLRAAVALVSKRLNRKRILFLALGENAPPEQIGQAEVHFIPFEKNPQLVARYYQAADLYVHAARADTFPNTILEALACGTPSVATAVGGILEQIKPMQIASDEFQIANIDYYPTEEATGVLVPPTNAKALAEGIVALLDDEGLRNRLGENAAQDASKRFDQKRPVDVYLNWYNDIAKNRLSS